MGRSSVCLFTLAALAGPARSLWAECPRAVIADGDPALVSGLNTRLAATGISTTGIAGCPALRVNIEQRGTQVHMRLADASQRTGERDVQDLSTAVAIVESWTYQEIEAGTLPEEQVVDATPAIVAPRRTNRSGVSASVISGFGTNGPTTWIGGSLASCVRVKSVCAGAALRSQLDTTATGQTSMLAQSSYSLGAFATLDLPRMLGRFILSPGIAVGYSYLHVTTTHHDAMNNPFDIPSADHQLRGGAHASLLRPWGAHLAAFVDVWADAAALRSNSQFGPTGWLTFSLGLRLEAQ